MYSRIQALLVLLLASSPAFACSPAVEAPLPTMPTGEKVRAFSSEDLALVGEVRGSFREPWRVGLFVRVTDAIAGPVQIDDIVEIEFMGGTYICGETWHSAQDVKAEEFPSGSRVFLLIPRSSKPYRVHTSEFGSRFRVLARREG
ncbi:hypothetical protein [Pseudomarimonas salicorniae]|uniref:Uncharacterized protein n=1 Tax=Pseudomarimonas salicorniae TaxID=2933270 RepID=A0ABT0GCQ8_9GAMM|nr:hypothetical protein [Lysobacter sp. CAU 1642]MCK7592329.1 hypothetical protein [Lysobacter sp. CAU 1642]